MTPIIRFRTKVKQITEADGSVSAYIEYKREVKRADTNMKPSDHAYFNSDLFPAMLKRAYQKVIGPGKEWVLLKDLPPGVTVDTSKFLAVVTVTLPENFR